ncbi:hypothetical protein [Mycolicibacterium sp. HS_4_1]
MSSERSRRRRVLPAIRGVAFLAGTIIATAIIYAYPMLLPAAIAAITTAVFLWERDAARVPRRGPDTRRA